VIGLYDAPAGTVTTNCEEVAEITLAFTAPKKTILPTAEVSKFEPVIVTEEPTGPEVGVTEVIFGGPNTKPASEPVPLFVVTLTLPFEPLPTTADMEVDELTVNDAAGVPPNFTEVAPVKFNPRMVTIVPAFPKVGEKELMIGPT